MYKRLLALFFVFMLTIPNVTVFAAPVTGQVISSDDVIQNSRWAVVNKLKSLDDSLDNTAFGQYGVLYNLGYLVEYAGYLDFMLTADDLAFSETEKDVYKEVYANLVENFNSRYGSETDGTNTPLMINVPFSTSDGEIKSSIRSLVETQVPEYCKCYLEVLQGEADVVVSGNTVTSGEESLDDYQREITRINQILEFMSQHKNTCLSMLPGLEDGQAEDTRLDDMANYNKFKTKLSESAVALAVLNAGKDLSSDVVDILGNVSYIDANTYIEQLANVSLNTSADDKAYGVELWSNNNSSGGFQLKDTYLAMLAASAVYTPFVSKVGDERYMKALESVAGSENGKKITRLYDEIKDFRKPLYMIQAKRFFSSDETVIDGEGTRKYSGDAKKITLAELLDYSGSSKEVALLTVTGDLKVNPEDGNSYAYFREYGPDKYLGTENSMQTLNVQSDAHVNPASVSADAHVNAASINADARVLANANYIPDGKTVSTVHWTDVLFELGDSTLGGSMNKTLLTNIERNLRNKKELEEMGKSYLYINPLGDIVLADNTVVIPGAANASLYTNVYNPFTVAFYNNYPDIKIHEEDIDFYDPDPVGKYILRLYDPTGVTEKVQLKLLDDSMITPMVAMYLIQGKGDIKLTSGTIGTYLVKQFYNSNQGTMEALHFVNKDINRIDSLATKIPFVNSSTAFAYFDTVGAENLAILPYDPGLDDGHVGASLIAKNMLWSYTVTKSGLTNTNNGTLKENYIFQNLVLEIMNGTPYAESFQKITAVNEDMVEPYGFWGELIVGMANGLLEIANTDGVLGLKGRYESSIFGKVFYLISDYSRYICIALGLVFLANFTRQRFNLTYTLSMTAFSVALVYAFINIFPVYVPYVFNSVINNTGKNLSYEITLVGSEVYEDAYGNAQEVDENGRFKEKIGSVNLYRMTNGDMDMLADKLAVDKSRFTNGSVYILDEQNGIYVEGDTLKVSLDALFYGNPIVGSYRATADGQLYQLKAYKENSSMVDYYMPYYQMVDGFVETLNTMLASYRIPRHTVQYLDGLSKDSFLVYSYVNSVPFLSPDDLGVDHVLQPDDAEVLAEKFGDTYDYLHIRNLIENPSEAVKQTVWYRTMDQNGYFMNTEESKQKREDLIYYVNYHTREFLIKLNPQLGFISDENLIKVVGLHATMLFNQRVSEYGNWLYPTMLNYPEFQLRDVYRVSLSDDTRKFAEANLDVVDYVYTEKGTFGVLGLLLDIALGWLISFIVPNVIMLLYLLMMLMLFYRFMTSEQLTPLLRGYFKSSFAFFLVYALFTTVTANVSNLLALFLFYTLIVMFLYGIVSSILGNITELGDGGFEKYWDRMASWFRSGNFKIGRPNWHREPSTAVNVNNIYGMNYDIGEVPLNRDINTPVYRQKKKPSSLRKVDAKEADWYDEDDWLDWR